MTPAHPHPSHNPDNPTFSNVDGPLCLGSPVLTFTVFGNRANAFGPGQPVPVSHRVLDYNQDGLLSGEELRAWIQKEELLPDPARSAVRVR